MAASKQDLSSWDTFQWKRRMERFGDADEPLIARGPNGEVDGICQLGELTDKGRQTTFELGQRLRHLYVERLSFLPEIISNTDSMYLRSTPVPRALESLQSAFWGLYPSSARTSDFAKPSIILRQLARLFAQRAADKWNDSEEMAYLNSLWSKWMPENSPRVAVDSLPRLSGIMDTVASTYAHGPNTRLPAEFYDPKAREIADRIGVDEWFAGSQESREYRKLAIGALMGDVVERMVHAASHKGWRPMAAAYQPGEESPSVKLAMSGCHDTTLASILSSVGAFKGERWPPYTSSIAVELFKDVSERDVPSSPAGAILEEFSSPPAKKPASDKPSFFSLLTGKKSQSASSSAGFARTPQAKQPALSNHYVRIRYNDRPVTIPGCAASPSKHLPGDKSFCTLEAFKEIVDKFTPANWRQECGLNLDKGMFPEGEQQPAGY
ncbi:hypothetical protein MGYG_07209 [Nannizzia gypsea CBS 118893]|uniref:Acid phosphatase n=1 Tax=Arthroderma gypseum (strain ATCC MYA-4604 / CBS 118893) TaxID=535722 RepID=E4V2D7_ARTGP|nr:hypothetical protein MGYG_07209 [Nannizzia gypsea CBS 118893]EFR04202.1 hypothetical protein MGYG_07209 [Nannizzia gypsea CBS 118893]